MGPQTTAPTPAPGLVPPITPTTTGTGMAGFMSLTNTIAGWTLIAAAAAALLGLLTFGVGPALGIQSGRRYGTLILLSSVAVAAGIGMIATVINLVYGWFNQQA